MAKRVRLSDDSGVTWFTLPGNTAELASEAGELDDTIFGQTFQSSQTGLIGWTVSSNGLYKGFAGYAAKILKPGTSTAMTTEAMTALTPNKRYQITSLARRVINRNVAFTIQDGGSIDNDDIESIDFLFGIVTLKDGVTVTTALTISGEYLPMQEVGCSNAFTLTQTANAVDNTCMSAAQANDGNRTFEYGLKTVSLDLQGIYKPANGFLTLLSSRTELVLEVNPDGNGHSVARGWFKAMNTGQSGDVGDLENESITFNLAVPQDDEDLIDYPFHWTFSSASTLSMSVRKAIEAWENNQLITVSYLPDGTSGVVGEAVITDITLAGGLEAMNEFTINLQGSDKLEAFPAGAPSGYSAYWLNELISSANEEDTGFTIIGGKAGMTFTYTITDEDTPANVMSGGGTITDESHSVTGLDVSTLVDGELTLSVTLTHFGTAGSAVTVVADKDTA